MTEALENELIDALKTEDPLKILRCAEANLKNISDRAPMLDGSPSWVIAVAQIKAVIANLEARTPNA